MDLDNSLVRSWKEYTPSGARAATGPVSAIDIDDVVNGGLLVAGSWSFSCCDTTLCSDCSIN